METIPDYIDILSISKFLYQKTIEDGGDGESVWLTKFYKLKDIVDIIENSKIEPEWTVELKDKSIIWWRDQEGVIITNDKEVFNAFTIAELKLQLH